MYRGFQWNLNLWKNYSCFLRRNAQFLKDLNFYMAFVILVRVAKNTQSCLFFIKQKKNNAIPCIWHLCLYVVTLLKRSLVEIFFLQKIHMCLLICIVHSNVYLQYFRNCLKENVPAFLDIVRNLLYWCYFLNVTFHGLPLLYCKIYVWS